MTTALNDNIYLYDTNVNFEKEYGYKYLEPRPRYKDDEGHGGE